MLHVQYGDDSRNYPAEKCFFFYASIYGWDLHIYVNDVQTDIDMNQV